MNMNNMNVNAMKETEFPYTDLHYRIDQQTPVNIRLSENTSSNDIISHSGIVLMFTAFVICILLQPLLDL